MRKPNSRRIRHNRDQPRGISRVSAPRRSQPSLRRGEPARLGHRPRFVSRRSHELQAGGSEQDGRGIHNRRRRETAVASNARVSIEILSN